MGAKTALSAGRWAFFAHSPAMRYGVAYNAKSAPERMLLRFCVLTFSFCYVLTVNLLG